MKLRLDELAGGFREAGIAVPEYDIRKMRERTVRDPLWLHFGGGNIFRAYIARLQDELLSRGLQDRGIIVASCFDSENLERVYRPYENLTVSVRMHRDGTLEKRVVGSVAEALYARDPAEMQRLREVAASPGLELISLTITEKGYIDRTGSAMEILAELLHARFQAGGGPLAVVSMDNCQENGTLLEAAVLSAAERLVREGRAEPEYLSYLRDRSRISFPWTMIDKITPRPSPKIRDILQADGLEGMEILETKKRSYIAPFVNAEASEYLIIEDDFPAGRPPLEAAGVILTDRGSVKRSERMKVMTCLNPLHTALAVYGCVLGYESIAAEMSDPALVHLIREIAREAMRVCEDPGILSPEVFLEEVLTERFPNPYVPDTPQRIATDSSQKIPIRYGETLKAYQRAVPSFGSPAAAQVAVAEPPLPSGSLASLTAIPTAIAGWLRYLFAVDDAGQSFTLSPDPKVPALTARLEGLLSVEGETFRRPEPEELRAAVLPILQEEEQFGINLEEAGLSGRILDALYAMLEGPGAVRRFLDGYLSRKEDEDDR